MPRLKLPADPRSRVAWLGHAVYAFSCLLLLVWYWLVDAHLRHALPRWMPTSESVVWDPAGLCALLGFSAIVLGISHRRVWAVLEGLWAVAVGLVGLIFVAFAYVFD